MLYRAGVVTIMPPPTRFPHPMTLVSFSPFRPSRRGGFTLLELMLVIAIIAVLVMMSWRGYGIYVKKADSVACATKMKNFYVGLQNYMIDKQTWPQEDVLNDANGNPPPQNKLWDWWCKQMKEFGVGRNDWYCPAELRQNPNKMKQEDEEEESSAGFKPEVKDPSYIPSQFSYGTVMPYQSNQPWLIESADFHGTGMNKLMPDAAIIREFSFDAIKKMRMAGSK
jgi:prepilin-type N-terminal cleavage/methylation domain-containing protein